MEQYRKFFEEVGKRVTEAAAAAGTVSVPEFSPATFGKCLAEWRKIIAQTTDLSVCDSDIYGDGDQSSYESTFPGSPGQNLTDVWAGSADISCFRDMPAYLGKGYITMFEGACFYGKAAEVADAIAGARANKSDPDALRKLLEKRWGVLRLTPLMLTVAASRTLAGPPQHLAVAKLLMAAGANLEAKDIAGYTALAHTTTAYSNEKSLQIAVELAKAGANPNTRDRAGRVPLYQPIMANKLAAVTLLCEAGADANIAEYPTTKAADGSPLSDRFTREGPTTPLSCARANLAMLDVISSAGKRGRTNQRRLLTGQRVVLFGLTAASFNGLKGVAGDLDLFAIGKDGAPAPRYAITLDDGRSLAVKVSNVQAEDREAAADALNKCAYCDAPACPTLCKGCMAVRYCNVDCQRAHWKKHRASCKEASSSGSGKVYVYPPKHTHHIGTMSWNSLAAGGGAKSAAKSLEFDPRVSKRTEAFVIKVQVPLAGPGPLAIYDKSREFQTMPDAGDRGYDELKATVKRQSGGVKAYLTARFVDKEEGGKSVRVLEVNISDPLPTQPW